jgi:hypothetical protein
MTVLDLSFHKILIAISVGTYEENSRLPEDLKACQLLMKFTVGTERAVRIGGSKER